MKGYPLHVVVDTYENLDNESAEPVHRAYCKVKIFRDKVGLQFDNTLQHKYSMNVSLRFSDTIHPHNEGLEPRLCGIVSLS